MPGRMSRSTRLLASLVAVTLLMTGCDSTDDAASTTSTTTQAPTTTASEPPPEGPEPLDPDGFYLALMWHQHQPLYPKNEDGVVTRPWVRVHATKDYYDMAAMLRDYPDVKATFNLTPVLLRQLEELATGTKDIYWTLTEVPAADLSDEQRQFVLDRFFDVNPRVIARFPRYEELAGMRDNPSRWGDDDVTDLQVLFNLAWTDPRFLAEAPLAALVEKGSGFTEEDKQIVLEEHLRIIREVIPVHTELWESGQIEVTTTPLAHPILPLIADTSLASAGDPAAKLPANRFQEIPDARAHVVRGLDEAERLLGKRPTGMWPGEGAVAQLVMSIFGGEGVEWVATGEDVLGATLGTGAFERSSDGTVLEPEILYRIYQAQNNRNPNVAMFFRDVRLSDQVGFEYSGMSAGAAVSDFMARLRNTKDALDTAGVTGPKVVSVILDGENAWENYDNDGIDFLEELYSALSNADWVRTVTPGELLDAFPEAPEPLPTVFPAAWFSPNFATWIGEAEEAAGWEYLYRARQDYRKAEQSGTIDEATLAAAFETMLFAEGSDWFWWYGSDQDSGDDGYFDSAFRELLGQMYDALGEERPPYVSVPIIPDAPVAAVHGQSELVSITVDNDVATADWNSGTRVDTPDHSLVSSVWAALDTENLYVRIDFVDEVLGDDSAAIDMYLGVPNATPTRGATLDGTILGFEASHVVSWRGTDPVNVRGPSPLPVLEREDRFAPSGDLPAGFDGNRIEFAIPLISLGPLEVGDRMLFRVEDHTDNLPGPLAPVPGPGLIPIPDISNVEVVQAFTDPTGDDYGPGTYVYPSDAVFTAGSYDLTEFTVGVSGDDVVFNLDVLASIQNPWNSPRGFSVQTFDIYIDKDPGAGTGARLLIPGRNAALPAENGWEYAITAEGWDPAIYVAEPDGSTEETKPTFAISVLADKGRVIVRVPASLLGGGDPAEWAFAVAVLSQEGFPTSGVRRVRDVQTSAEQYRIGGGTGAINETRILDAIAPAGAQESGLGGFTPITSGSVDDLGPDDFPTLPLAAPA